MSVAEPFATDSQAQDEAIERGASYGRTPQSIIWLASYPKSGNTWIRVFAHNLIKELSGSSQTQNINRLHEHTGWEFGAKPFEAVLQKPFAEASHQELAQARPGAQAWLAGSRKGPFLTKTHLCVGREFGIPTINLDVTLAAIYVVRNPLDVAISFAHHLSEPVDNVIAKMAQDNFTTANRERHVYEIMGSWSQHVASWIGIFNRPIHIMRYEDMLAHPEHSFGALARFLGLDPTQEQLKSAIAKSSFAELKRQESERGFREKPPNAESFFREGTSGQWVKALSPTQVQNIVRAHAPMMQRFGYVQPSCGMPIRVGPPF
ncbi:hypothetical protein ABH975_002360 [Bradyrhizobium ottawaense]|uniref:sulfotransferase domain-containing protein n=1 Tax=Bradyrhizobium ottawaense TaxID=931866 RepID=UPI003511B7E5